MSMDEGIKSTTTQGEAVDPATLLFGRTVKRTAGSCRFSPYFKLEWFDKILCVWRPLQKSFATIALAEQGMTKGKQWRMFEVSEQGMRMLP